MRARRWMIGLVLLLGACSDDDDEATVTSSAADATTSPPATTPPASSVGEATAAAATAATAESAATLPATAAPASGVPTSADAAGYTVTSWPQWPADSSTPVSSPLTDGRYWATIEGADVGGITFVLGQVFLGAACTAQFPDEPETCLGDLGVLSDPTATVSLAPGSAAAASVLGPLVDQSYVIDAAELTRLAAGAPPGPDAPDGFVYAVGAPFFVTIEGGEVTAAEQVFTS